MSDDQQPHEQNIDNAASNQGAQGTFHGPQTVQRDHGTHGTAITRDNYGQTIGVSTGTVHFTQYGQPTPELLDHLAHALRAYHQRLRERQANQRKTTIERPYKFLDYFELEDENVFYGRALEIEQVYHLQQRSRLAVLHAPSGAGKTSLLQAGLMPRLLKEHCLPVYVRTGAHPLHTVFQQLLPPTDWASALSEKRFAEVLGALHAALPRVGLNRLVFIFDQFEELFVGTTREARFQLAAEMKGVVAQELAVSLLISIRDDYLSRLGGDFNPALPSILNNQQRLDAMNAKRAEEAITRPLLAFYPPRHYAPDLLSVLLTDLATGYDAGVALPHLQIVCTELYRRQPANEHTITLALYDQAGRAAGILGGYLQERLRWLGDRADLSRAVLKELVSSEATRRQVREASLQQRYSHQADHLAEVLTTLVEQRILRRLDDEAGSAYEVAHEYLIEEVRQWLDESDFELKRAQDMLEREVANYRSYGMLMPRDRLVILTEHRTQLQLDDVDSIACVILSASAHGEDLRQWATLSAAVESLVSALHSQHTHVRRNAAEALGKAAETLGKLDHPQAVDALVNVLQHNNDVVVRRAVVEILSKATETLGKLDHPQAVDALLHALQHDTDVEVRRAAAKILGKSDHRQVVDALVHVLQYHSNVDIRRAAAEILADLGDPRYPVTPDEWRTQTSQRRETFGAPEGYWCYVRPGTYTIGEEGKASANITLPGFWIARYPITVAQYRAFIDDGGYDKQDYWTPEGWQWRQEYNHTQPYRWGDARYSSANQAVIGVSWYEGWAFCAWLTAQLANVLPDGYAVQLPTEAEWEAAAAYDEAMQRHTYPWGDTPEPTPEHAIFKDEQGNNLDAPTPVGVCPAGAAACGALDMGGQVWEYCRSSHDAYPQGANAEQPEFKRDNPDVPLRGGSWHNNRTSVRCAARVRSDPYGNGVGYDDGFRGLLSPRVPPHSR